MKNKRQKNPNPNAGDAGGASTASPPPPPPPSEGAGLLGEPTFVEIGGGRWRCAETGHELLPRDLESYSKSRACRVALIDAAVASGKPPLNAFRPHPTSKSMLICSITGHAVNKTEEHIWKHINGKKFLNKLEQLETEHAEVKEVSMNGTDQSEKHHKEKPKKAVKKNKQKDVTLPREKKPEIDDSDDPDFWMPPVGSRWDFDDGKDRWESLQGEDQETESPADKGNMDGEEDHELSTRTKRMSIVSVGPSSFASRKKKSRKT